MTSSTIYNKLQQYLIEDECISIFPTLICVNWTRPENEERNEWKIDIGGGVRLIVQLVNHLDNKKPFKRVPKQLFSAHLRVSVGLPQVKSLRSNRQSLGIACLTLYILLKYIKKNECVKNDNWSNKTKHKKIPHHRNNSKNK